MIRSQNLTNTAWCDAAAADELSAAEDATSGVLWFWELREVPRKALAKANKKLAEMYRKRRKDVSAKGVQRWVGWCLHGWC